MEVFQSQKKMKRIKVKMWQEWGEKNSLTFTKKKTIQDKTMKKVNPICQVASDLREMKKTSLGSHLKRRKTVQKGNH